MSTTSIPAGPIAKSNFYNELPRSFQIARETLTLYTELGYIETKMKEEEASRYETWHPQYALRHTKSLANIINVFNDNVSFANKEIEKFIPFQKQSLEQYCDEHPGHTLDHYNLHESTRKTAFKEMKREVVELYQLGDTFHILSKKITLVLEKLREKNSLDKTIPIFPLIPCVKPTHPPAFHNFKNLRHIEPPKAPIAIQKPMEKTSASAVQGVNTSAKIDVTVLTNLGPEQTLGICCEPNWAEQPISFTPCENGWQGQVPMNQPWKFVTLENGKVANWEQLEGNRFCDSEVMAFTVQANEVRF